MDNEKVRNWVKKFGQAWMDRDPAAVLALMAENVEYWETPFEKPIIGKEHVEKLWEVVPDNQKNVKFSFDEIYQNEGGEFLIHWQVTRTKLPSEEIEEIDGIFLVRIDNHGLCTKFNQWRASRII